jgi:hypothetical protein
LLALLPPLVLLAGCDKTDRNDARSASGEVLEGTISDDMLPLDKLKSQPPLLAPSKQGAATEAQDEDASGESDATSEASEEPADETAPAPQASPSGTP